MNNEKNHAKQQSGITNILQINNLELAEARKSGSSGFPAGSNEPPARSSEPPARSDGLPTGSNAFRTLLQAASEAAFAPCGEDGRPCFGMIRVRSDYCIAPRRAIRFGVF